MAGRHDWNSWDHYRQIHERRLQDFGDFIEQNALEWLETAYVVTCEGSLRCRGGFKIDVEKLLDVDLRGGRPFVRTRRYSYHVYRPPDVNLFRYDNFHVHPEHPDSHHRHIYEPTGQRAVVEWVGEHRWPTLGDVIGELFELLTRLNPRI